MKEDEKRPLNFSFDLAHSNINFNSKFKSDFSNKR